jgi:hypothetical protein
MFRLFRRGWGIGEIEDLAGLDLPDDGVREFGAFSTASEIAGERRPIPEIKIRLLPWGHSKMTSPIRREEWKVPDGKINNLIVLAVPRKIVLQVFKL